MNDYVSLLVERFPIGKSFLKRHNLSFNKRYLMILFNQTKIVSMEIYVPKQDFPLVVKS